MVKVDWKAVGGIALVASGWVYSLFVCGAWALSDKKTNKYYLDRMDTLGKAYTDDINSCNDAWIAAINKATGKEEK